MSCEYCLSKNQSKYYFLRSANPTHSLLECTHIYGIVKEYNTTLDKFYKKDDFQLSHFKEWLSCIPDSVLKRLVVANNGIMDQPRKLLEKYITQVLGKNVYKQIGIMVYEINYNVIPSHIIIPNITDETNILFLQYIKKECVIKNANKLFNYTSTYFDLIKECVSPFVFTKFINVLTVKCITIKEELKVLLKDDADTFQENVNQIHSALRKIKSLVEKFKIEKYGPLFIRVHHNRDLYRHILSFI